MDVGGILTRSLDDLWDKVSARDDPAEVIGVASAIAGGQHVVDRPLINGFLVARKGSQFMRLWHAVFVETMRERTNARGVGAHPLVAHLSALALPAWFPIDVEAAQMADYVGQFSAAGRLFALVDATNGWDGPAFFMERLVLLPCGELFVHNVLTGFDGERQFAHMALSRSEPIDRADPQQAAAEVFVETTLARSTLVKMSQGFMPRPVQLATVWDRPENGGADVAPGTWAEYFRWASVHLDQSRELVPLSKEEKFRLRPKRVWSAGVLEVIDSATPVQEWK